MTSQVGSAPLTFLDVSNSGAQGFALCYAFGNEPYKLFTNIRVFAKDFVGLSTSTGNSNTTLAGVDFFKPFVFLVCGTFILSSLVLALHECISLP